MKYYLRLFRSNFENIKVTFVKFTGTQIFKMKLTLTLLSMFCNNFKLTISGAYTYCNADLISDVKSFYNSSSVILVYDEPEDGNCSKNI